MPPSIVFIAFGWSTDSPCNSHTNCSWLKFLTSCSLRGQLNFPFSSLLYSMINPSPSYPNIRIRRFIRRFLLSEHFCGTRLDADDQALFLQKNMRIKIYLKPQSRANSSSSSGHSGTSLPEDITGFPISMALRFCSKDGNA